MKVIIAGSRSISDIEVVRRAIDNSGYLPDITEIVSGAARGVDTLGEKCAESLGIPVKRFPANWKEYGRSAGPIRNFEMSNYSDALIAVWDGKSPGTKHMIENARRRGLMVHVEKV